MTDTAGGTAPLTKQEIFNRAFLGLESQGFKRCLSPTIAGYDPGRPIGYRCAYESPDGKQHCAWGWVDTSLKIGDFGGVSTLKREGKGLAATLDDETVRFAVSVQQAHDTSDSPTEMRDRLLQLAKEHGLTVPVPTRQEMFNRAVRGLQSQGWKRCTAPGGTCLYTGSPEEGVKEKHCAWGWVDPSIPDTVYGTTASLDKLFPEGLYSRLSMEDKLFASALQGIHDWPVLRTLDGMKRSAKEFAVRNRLTIPEDVDLSDVPGT